MKESGIHEALASLYLRLNGYFTSGLIVHAPEDSGSTRTEVDVLAVRFPQNTEPEREVEPSPYLEVSTDHIDFIISEVKGGKKRLQFNAPLRQPQSIRAVLRWMGAFTPAEIDRLQADLLTLMQPREQAEPSHFIEVPGPHGTRIRAILFGMDRGMPKRNQPKYIPGTELMGFIWNCMRPEQPRPLSQTTYDFQLWGSLYEPVVRYFKSDGRHVPGSVRDLVQFVIRTTDQKRATD